MRVLVTGDRHWRCRGLADEVIGRLCARYGADNLVIVHGHCPTGVDSAFDAAAQDAIVEVERHPADWHKHGPAAGPIRNQAMVDAGADFALAVHRFIAGSKGTRDCASRCLRANIPTYLIDSDAATPRRIASV